MSKSFTEIARHPSRFAAILALGIAVAIAFAATNAFAVVNDSGTVDVRVPSGDNTTSVVDKTTAKGAFVSYFGDKDTTFGASGTGIFDPFVRLQNSPSESGYNTNGTLEFNTKTGTWTHAIKVSNIPQRPCPGGQTCFELFNDINESNANQGALQRISLNKVEVFYADSATVTGYSGFGGHASLQYAYTGDILINDVNQGSGRGDLRYLIPIGGGANQVPLPANCNYGNPLCNTWFVLYSEWGLTPTGAAPFNDDWTSDGGFEEWKVKIYPAISLTKTPNPTDICNGSSASVTYTYVVTNNSPGGGAVSGSIVDDNGTLLDTADDVTVGTFSKLAAGASKTFTKVFTVNGTRTNIATATATDPDGQTATATATAKVNGHTCTISITKTPNPTDVCSQGGSVTYTYVVTNTGDFFNVSGTVTDDIYGAIGSFGPLAPGASKTLTKTATVTGTVTNTGTANGTFTDAASTTASATAKAKVTAHTCTISITKTPSVTDVCSQGGSVTYTYVVTNTGDFFSVSGTVTDDIYGAIGSFGPLAPGASKTLTKTATVTGTVTNTGTANGTFTDGASTTASATAKAKVTAHTCTISITKTPNPTSVCSGSNTNVTYTYVVTNTGDFFSVSGTVTDDIYGAIGSFGPLAPGASKTLTKTATVNSTVTNVGTASGTFTDPKPTTATATATATVTAKNCSQITPTNVDCSLFKSGTAPSLSEIQYSLKDGKINQTNPGVFFYWVNVSGPGPFTINQTMSANTLTTKFAVASGAFAFDSNCNSITSATITQNADGSVTITGAGISVIGVKFSTGTVVGQPAPNPSSVTYTFALAGDPTSAQSINLNLKP